MDQKTLQKHIEAILFYKSEPVSAEDLAKILETDSALVAQTLEHLSDSLTDRGITLVCTGDQYSLVTSPDVSAVIEKVVKEELNRDLSTASLETLCIVAYKGLVSRKEIEYIRGVNSSYSLRALLLRGLIEKEPSRLDDRVFLYKPTRDLLLHLGIKSIQELPEWASLHAEIEKAEPVEEDEV